MAIEIKAPLAERLFALGTLVGDESTPMFKGSNRGSGYRGQAPQMAPQEQGGAGGAGAIGAVAGSLLGAYMNSSEPAPTDASGNGFGLGGNLASGQVGDASYAGSRRPGILESFGGQGPEQNAGQNGLFDGFRYGGY